MRRELCPFSAAQGSTGLAQGEGAWEWSGIAEEWSTPEDLAGTRSWRTAFGKGAGLADAFATVMESQFLVKNDKGSRNER